MLKQLSKIGMLICLLAVATSAFAQEESKKENAPEYPHYGFWSNWSIGGEVLGTNDIDKDKVWDGGINLFLEKRVSNAWSLRLNATSPCLFVGTTPVTDPKHYGDYTKISLDMKFSINKAIAGYNPNCRWSTYVMLGPGAMFFHDQADNEAKAGTAAVMVEAGVGFSWQFCDGFTAFVEAVMDAYDYANIFKGHWHNMNGSFGIGGMYNFGVTKVDQELIAQRALLTQENFDALNEQVSGLEEEVAIAKANEQRLETRITELENELAEVRNANSKEADSLRHVIDQIKSEQSKFYALPFSILFGIDQSSISGAQQGKLKAIAKVMKDNPEAKFTIVGYCDYTGSDAYNIKLSQKRAENVKNALVNRYGIAADRLSCDWKGKSEAYGDIKYSINRRVAFYRVIE